MRPGIERRFSLSVGIRILDGQKLGLARADGRLGEVIGNMKTLLEMKNKKTCWSSEWQSAREASRERQAAAAALDPLRTDRPKVTKGAPKHPPVIDFCQIPESNLRINLDTTAGFRQ